MFRGIILFAVGLRWFEGNFGDFNRIMIYKVGNFMHPLVP